VLDLQKVEIIIYFIIPKTHKRGKRSNAERKLKSMSLNERHNREEEVEKVQI
jgi:hypothetical protein